MPKTLQGFLMLAGVVLFVGSLFVGSVKYKDTELPASGKRARLAIRISGILFMVASALLYAFCETTVFAPPPG